MIKSVKKINLSKFFYSTLLILVMAPSLGFSQASPKILTLSDIDDTLKVSHVLNTVDSALNALRTDNLFRGMSTLYRSFLQRDPRMSFVYLSAAPQFLMQESHTEFLRSQGFPAGPLILRTNLPRETHKILKIREILRVTQPQYVIAIGDNGELDPLVYAQAQKEFPQIRFFTYIRRVYSEHSRTEKGAPLKPGQVPFVTPMEIAMDLALKGFLQMPQLEKILTEIVPPMIQSASYEDRDGERGELSFPVWQDCRGQQWSAAYDGFRWQQPAYYQALKRRVQMRCSRSIESLATAL